MNALVADCDRNCREHNRFLLEQNGCDVQVATNGLEALNMLKAGRFDFLSISIVMAIVDGIALLESILDCQLYRYPFTVVQTALGSEVAKRALALGADAVQQKPADEKEYISLLKQAKEQPSRFSTLAALRVVEWARERICALGVPPHLKGFDYLASAVAVCYADDRLLGRATSLLYPRVAEQCGATAGGVEHAIRQAIETTWTKGSMELLTSTFGNSIDPQRGKPTNTECIALLVEQLRKDCNWEA